LQPAFGDMLPDWNQMPAWVDKQLDDECDLADIILVGSSFAMKSFITQGVPKEKIRIVPYGTDVALFKKVSRNSSPSDPLRVVFVGRIGQLKGISYLLEAARRLPGKQFSFTLVGGIQGDKKALLPYENYFTYTPHQPRAMLPQVYRNQDVFVFPTLLEGMGLVVLEAMASGLPVITTANGPGDIVRDGIDGFIVPVRNYDAICDCLEILRARPELREEMSRNARQRALEYSWDAYMERIAGLVSDLDIRAGEH